MTAKTKRYISAEGQEYFRVARNSRPLLFCHTM